MTHLRTGKQRGKKPVALRMVNYQVGWRAYTVDDKGNTSLIAVGRDIFHCSSVEMAMKIALKQIPIMISEPDAQVGIRYVKEKK